MSVNYPIQSDPVYDNQYRKIQNDDLVNANLIVNPLITQIVNNVEANQNKANLAYNDGVWPGGTWDGSDFINVFNPNRDKNITLYSTPFGDSNPSVPTTLEDFTRVVLDPTEAATNNGNRSVLDIQGNATAYSSLRPDKWGSMTNYGIYDTQVILNDGYVDLKQAHDDGWWLNMLVYLDNPNITKSNEWSMRVGNTTNPHGIQDQWANFLEGSLRAQNTGAGNRGELSYLGWRVIAFPLSRYDEVGLSPAFDWKVSQFRVACVVDGDVDSTAGAFKIAQVWATPAPNTDILGGNKNV